MKRHGFALALVMAALVLISMVVAVGAQRALLAVRQGALAMARSDLTVVALGAEAAALGAPADSARTSGLPPGVVLATGTQRSGSAVAEWSMTVVSPSVVIAEIAATSAVSHGAARARYRAVLSVREDSVRGRFWAPLGGSTWVQVPSP